MQCVDTTSVLHLVPLALKLGPALGDALGRLCEALVRPAEPQAPSSCPPYCVQALKCSLDPEGCSQLGCQEHHILGQDQGGPPRLPHYSCVEGTQVLRTSQLLKQHAHLRVGGLQTAAS